MFDDKGFGDSIKIPSYLFISEVIKLMGLRKSVLGIKMSLIFSAAFVSNILPSD